MPTIRGKHLHHTYKMKDNWDGNFCPDYCIGCGDCDHFPTNFAVMGFKQKVKDVEYYCKKCYNTEESFLFSIRKCKEEKETDITLNDTSKESSSVTCKKCEKIIEKETDIETNYNYFTRIVCVKCAKNNGLIKEGYDRCRDKSFHCDSCNTKYKINPNYGHIKCENISKLNEYRSKEMSMNVENGKITYNEIVEKVPQIRKQKTK